MQDQTQSQPIGVFDSGMGGISVLKDLVKLMPHEHFLYYGDTQNAPYGTRPESEILHLTQKSAQLLLKNHIKALVIACNTATSAAAESLRADLPIPVIGMEPALKPAALDHPGERILVMATPATLRQRKFEKLFSQYGDSAEMLPCPGLMEFVEREELDSPALMEYLRDKLLQDTARPIKAIVLGCTHYIFLKKAIKKVLPHVTLYDGNLGTAHQLMTLLNDRNQLNHSSQGSVKMMTSGDEAHILPVMYRLFELE